MSQAATAAPEVQSTLDRLKAFLAFRPETAAILALITVSVVFSFTAADFTTKAALYSIITLASERGIVACGVSILLIAGHFDLSVGSVLGLTAITVGTLMMVNPALTCPPLWRWAR